MSWWDVVWTDLRRAVSFDAQRVTQLDGEHRGGTVTAAVASAGAGLVASEQRIAGREQCEQEEYGAGRRGVARVAECEQTDRENHGGAREYG
jgi:hypothetical protein